MYINKNRIRKLISTLLVGILTTINIATPLQILASSVTVSTPSSTVTEYLPVTVDKDDIDIHIEIEIPKPSGTLNAARITLANNSQGSDFQLDIDSNSILDTFSEYQSADIKEFDLGNSVRKLVTISENIGDYASKLNYLINQNILTRQNSFLFTGSSIQITEDRYQLPIHDDEEQKWYVGGESNTNHKYSDPYARVSATDFITNLMKLSGIETSRLIGVQIPYTRNGSLINNETINNSIYRDYLGELGLDSYTSDINVDHTLFGDLTIFATNDVTEYYLLKAINAGIITTEDLGGVEGEIFLNTILRNMNTPAVNSWVRTDPLRQNYISSTNLGYKSIDLLNSVITAEYFRDALEEKFDTVTRNVGTYTSPIGNERIWGSSYLYVNTDNIYSYDNLVELSQIVKRPSYIEVIDGFYDPNRNDLGYQYLKSEAITLAQAYVYAYKYLKVNDTDTKIPEKTVNAIVSSYGMDFAQLNSEELQAVQYLIAKGIIDPDDTEILYSTSRYITNNEMIDLLYRIYNKDARFEMTASLSETDEDMLIKGYYKNTIEFSTTSGTTTTATYSYSDGNSTWTAEMIKERQQNLSAYDYVYIRLPKGFDMSNNSYLLMGNDEYRVTIPAYNYYINGGNDITEETIKQVSSLLKSGEKAYSTDTFTTDSLFTQNDNRYVFYDGTYYWVRYIIPKSSSANVTFKISTNSNYYILNGIDGEGIYYLKDESNIYGTLEKLSINKQTSVSKRLISVVVENDEKMRDELQKRVNEHNVANTINSNNSSTTSAPTTTDKGTDAGLNSENTSKLFSSVIGLRILDSLKDTLISMISPTEVFADTIEYFSSGESITNSSPLKATDQLGLIRIGPYNENTLVNLTFSGVYDVITSDGYGNYSINAEKLKNSIHYSSLQNTTIVRDGDDYYLEYPTVESSIAFELSSFVQQLGLESSVQGITVPGYSQISSSTGERVNLISETNFKSVFNVEVVSDKTLINRTTGQKAFLNDTDNYTMIGNNITKYEADKMFVIALGDELYYNLDIILELVNDSNTVVNNIGKNTDIYVSNSYIFTQAEIYNNNTLTSISQSDTQAELMDRTYILYNQSNPLSTGVYVNLSSISSKVSNMLIFKDTTTDVALNMMVVYYPKETDIYNTTTPVNNGIMYSAMATRETATDYTIPTKILSTYLFSAGGYISNNDELQSSSSTILPTDYQYDVYFLINENSTGSGQVDTDTASAVFDTFVQKLSTLGNSSTLLNNSVIDANLNTGSKYGDPTKSESNTNIRFSTLALSVNAEANNSNKSYFFLEKGTNNLYFRLLQVNAQGTGLQSNSEEYLKIFKNRLWLNPDSINSENRVPEMRFRSTEYYTDTPVGALPLELMTTSNVGEINSTTGEAISGLAPITISGQEVELTVRPTDKDGTANVIIPILSSTDGMNEMALFTTITSNRFFNLDNLLSSDVANNNVLSKATYTGSSSLGRLNAQMQSWLENIYAQAFPKHKYKNENSSLTNINAFQPTVGTNQAIYSSLLLTNTEIAEMFIGTWDILEEFYSITPSKGGFLGIGAMPYYRNVSLTRSELPTDLQTITSDFSTLHLGIPPEASSFLKGLGASKAELGVILTWTVVGNEIYLKEATPIKESDLNSKKDDLLTQLKSLSPTKELYIQGVFPIPAGTTVVTKEGLLTTVLSETIKIKSNYISDINNALLTRMMLLTNDVMYLSEVPDKALVTVGSGTTYTFVKTSAYQGDPSTLGSSMQWEQLMLLPTSDETYNYTQASDYGILHLLLSKGLFNLTIPLTEGAQGTKVTFSQVMGSGLWSFPTRDILKSVSDSLRKGTGTADYTNKNTNIFNRSSAFNIWGRTENSTLSTLYKVDSSNNITALDESKTLTSTGFLMPILLLSPTIVVEPNTTTGAYDIIGYIDSSYYNIDLKNEYVQYLQSRNTKAYSPSETLQTILGYDMNGDYFKKWETNRLTEKALFGFLVFITDILPTLLTVYWLIITCIFTLQFIPALQNIFLGFADLINFDIISFISCGLLKSGDDSRENVYPWLKFSFIIITLVVCLFRLILLEIIVNIWQKLI